MDLQGEVVHAKTLITCPICLDVLDNAVSGTCDHVFCRACLERALAVKTVCPLCGTKTIKRDIRDISALDPIIKLFQNVITAHEVLNSHVTSSKGPPSSSSAIKPSIVNESRASQASTTDNIPSTSSETTMQTQSLPAEMAVTIEDISFKEGTLVNVLPRTWAGINKLGGVGRVESVKSDPTGGFSYNVKYVLDGNRDEDVPSAFVELYVELGRSGRRSKHGADSEAPHGNQKTARRSVGSDVHFASSSSIGSRARSKSTQMASNNNKENDGENDNRSRASASNRSIVIVTTAIDAKSGIDHKLEDFVLMASNAVLRCSFSDEVTHLVVSVDRNNIMKQRTMKYMQALARGLWVVSTKWIEDSLAAGRVVNESSYEVRGNIKAYIEQAPKRARMNKMRPLGQPMPKPLLDGFRVLLFGMFPLPGPAKSDLEFLLVHCGAALCRSVEQLVAPSDVSSQGIVICSSGEDSTDQAGEAHTAIRSALGDSAGAQPLVVSAVWLMDCVTNFTAVSPSKYLLP